MRIKYFETTNQDFIKSPGWFKRLLVMGLIYFIPIFGPLVIQSYLYGWAREAALGVRNPLPPRIFGNEDGQLYRRGWRLFAMQILYSLLPILIMMIASFALMGAIFSATEPSVILGFAFGYFALMLVLLPLMLGLMLVIWAAGIRTTVYGSVSAGLQLGEVFKMLKRDFGGILRILGMYILIIMIVSIAVETVIFIVMFIGGMFMVGFAAGSGMSGSAAEVLIAFGSVALMLPLYYVMFVTMLYPLALSTRALGYWARGVLPDLWQASAGGGAWPAQPQPGYAPAPPQPEYTPPQQPPQPSDPPPPPPSEVQ
ncbi:MAG: DUF4013 domain-containing protein [Coriobacteriales bacterium]|nr:DUF4013 domain-containing protein [Coriobacteriales bacterium]